MNNNQKNHIPLLITIISLAITCGLLVLFEMFSANIGLGICVIIVVHLLSIYLIYANIMAWKIDSVQRAINSIPHDLTLDDNNYVLWARRQYDCLPIKYQARVTSYPLLIDAESLCDYLEKHRKLIIGVLSVSESNIQELRKEYDRLGENLQKRIKNISILDELKVMDVIQQIAHLEQIYSSTDNFVDNDTILLQIKKIRELFDKLPANCHHKVINYNLLEFITRDIEHVETEKEREQDIAADLKNKIEEYSSYFNTDSPSRNRNINYAQLSLDVLMDLRDSYDSLDSCYQSTIINYSSLEDMISMVQKRISDSESKDISSYDTNNLRVFCSKRELDKRESESEKISHALICYCESSKNEQKKYKNEFERWINYFINIHLDSLPVNADTFRFALTIGNYYYDKIHSNHAARPWYKKAKEIFESQAWDFSNYASDASSMYKVIADMAEDLDTQITYYKASFFCDTSNKETYNFLIEKDPENEQIYSQYRDKIHPLNAVRMEKLFDKVVEKTQPLTDTIDSISSTVSAIASIISKPA